MFRSIILSGFALLLFSGLAGAASVADQVQVEDPYARAVPPGLPNSASFMRINNPDQVAHKLVAAESPAADVVELHTHINDNGVMRMRRVDAIELPAGSTTELKPGGLHVMLIGLRAQLKPGDEIQLSLEFEDGSKTALSLPVKKIQVPMMKCGRGKCGGGKCGGGKCGGGKCGGK